MKSSQEIPHLMKVDTEKEQVYDEEYDPLALKHILKHNTR